jgi:hypothetical protein
VDTRRSEGREGGRERRGKRKRRERRERREEEGRGGRRERLTIIVYKTVLPGLALFEKLGNAVMGH